MNLSHPCSHNTTGHATDAAAPNQARHLASDLVLIFNRLFRDSRKTELVFGTDEPIYLPRTPQRVHAQIVFAHGYFSSALHEVAHWCIAGKKRRKMEDFGYWYEPDGRDSAQQAEFERVEVKPQALEWYFSLCCAYPFVISVDNLNGDPGDGHQFKQRVEQQLADYLHRGLPNRRARAFARALQSHYHTRLPHLPPQA